MTESTQTKAEVVSKRLAANEETRKAEIEKRREESSVNADPRESVAGFLAEFKLRAGELSTRISALCEQRAETTEATLDSIASDVQSLERQVADATYFLPAYDARASNGTVAALRERMAGLRSKQAPRKKFAFSKDRKKAAAAPDASSEVPKPELAPPAPKIGSPRAPASTGPGIRHRKGEKIVVDACDLPGGEYVLEDLEDVEIWLCGPVRALFIHRVKDCKIYTGPVLGSALIETAEKCTMAIASQQIRVHSAHDICLYLRVRSNPIVEHCTGVLVAPYAVAYPGLPEQLAVADLASETNLWDKVNDFGWLRAVASPNWGVLPEAGRLEFQVPAADGSRPKAPSVAAQAREKEEEDAESEDEI
ncbi:hypothetical protein CYMTET_4582 [Cymbomonas tetramitiformis]|uniref:C-CAP/cofactor C-like domain-containing protein n=1 Tax=Cymbomonas tetramitiformis TaxID=36881 RepID=A0AAE0LJX2_9CHLO|nr:hypothetical protein CYMTET_4582 [Cymbomonas tetramitiformis]